MDLEKLSKEDYISQTKKWIERLVIEMGLCPFAAKPYYDSRVLIKCIDTVDVFKDVEICLSEMEHLVRTPKNKVSNILLIFPYYNNDFEEFLDFFYICEEELMSTEWEKYVQMTSFHPYYQFVDTHDDDMANYTNRSPHAMVHLLRTDEMAEAIERYGDTNLIYQRNIKLLRELGLTGIKDQLKN